MRTGSYWEAYRAVLIKAVCDSVGNVKSAEILHSFAPPAESDSILALVLGMKFDPKNWTGQVRRWKHGEIPTDSDLHFVVPFATQKLTLETRMPSQDELEEAGLKAWLTIWKELIPDWPVESWGHTWKISMYKLPPEYETDHAERLARGMVITSPGGDWQLHPFYGVHVGKDGKVGYEPDGGFVLYQQGIPHRARQLVTGTPVSYTSAEWIDEERFVVTGTSEVDLTFQDKWVNYRAPFICIGRVDSLEILGFTGPPIPIRKIPAMRDRLREYRKERYAKVFSDN